MIVEPAVLPSVAGRVPIARPSIGPGEMERVMDVLLAGEVSSVGVTVPAFEEEFASFCDAGYAVAASNGTASLHLALAALGVGPGDEVIVPAFTYVATANAVQYTGATPVFVDVNPNHWQMCPAAADAAVTSRTRAIIPVHLYGHPAPMDEIRAVAARAGAAVIEDAAQAHGALYKGQRVGSIGDFGSFSFFGNKILTTGEGGIVTGSNADFLPVLRQLRNHGMDPDRRYFHPVVGFNYRMTSMQAAIGLAQMGQIHAFLRRRSEIAERYREALADVRGISLQPVAPWATPVCWFFNVLLDPDAPFDATELVRRMDEQGVETRPFFPAIPSFPPYSNSVVPPVSADLGRRGVSLPTYTELSDAHVDSVTEALRRSLM